MAQYNDREFVGQMFVYCDHDNVDAACDYIEKYTNSKDESIIIDQLNRVIKNNTYKFMARVSLNCVEKNKCKIIKIFLKAKILKGPAIKQLMENIINTDNIILLNLMTLYVNFNEYLLAAYHKNSYSIINNMVSKHTAKNITIICDQHTMSFTEKVILDDNIIVLEMLLWNQVFIQKDINYLIKAIELNSPNSLKLMCDKTDMYTNASPLTIKKTLIHAMDFNSQQSIDVLLSYYIGNVTTHNKYRTSLDAYTKKCNELFKPTNLDQPLIDIINEYITKN